MQRPRSLWQNPVSVIGFVLAGLCVLFFISFQAIDLVQSGNNPYTGLWVYLVVPAVLVVALLTVPLGWLLERRRRRRLAPDAIDQRLPLLDPNNPGHMRALLIFGIGTLIVVPLIALASYEGYHYTDSTQFCGQVCHSVMHPEYTTYKNSPHARVTCAACHIGPGADWFVKSKISGVRQVFAVMFQTYSKPIPTPVRDLRPARETCEQCHWPAKFYGAQLRTRPHYASDEENTRREIRMLVKTGGGESAMGKGSGIHWHMALSQKIEYVGADWTRQAIPWVRATDSSGRQTVYRSDGKQGVEPPPGEMRAIDCMDCHNRPTHIVQPPDRAVNISIESGRMDANLPWVKKVSTEALTQPYGDEQEADAGIAAYFREFYQKLGSSTAATHQTAIEQAIAETRAVYRRNFFPRMKVDWRVYPDNIGHMLFTGCFRCHDGKHVSAEGTAISRDCTVCHDFQQPVTEEGRRFIEITAPEHPVKLEGEHANLNCSACHSGGRAPEPTCEGCHTMERVFRQGKSPLLPGMSQTPPSIMAELSCESCHDLTRPQTQANIGMRCDSCHEKGYGNMIQSWKDEVASARANAAAAIDALRKRLEQGGVPRAEREGLHQRLAQLQGALTQVDRAGPHHNMDLAGAVYEEIVKAAAPGGKDSAAAVAADTRR